MINYIQVDENAPVTYDNLKTNYLRMKRIILLSIYCIVFANAIYSQAMPVFVRQKLDSIKKEARKALMDYRIGDGYMRLPFGLGFYLPGNVFSYDETQLIDSLNLKVNIGMIYDDAMRNRIVELMQNKFQEYELDTLINRQMSYRIIAYERVAMETCLIDTLPLFKITLDSLCNALESQNALDLSKQANKVYNYEVFKFLKLDTTTRFQQVHESLIEKEKKQWREYLLTNKSYYRADLAELCGYIGDKRFIQPLIEALGKAEEDYQKKKILEALARMRVEPYYRDYVKYRTRPLEQVKDANKNVGFDIDDFVYVLGTQESFLELSKYLFSNYIYARDSDDSSGTNSETAVYYLSEKAFDLIQENIMNEDLQKIINGRSSYSNPELLQSVYDWMQKNYGKYKIKRIW
jgi:hypothetical protein